MPVRVYSNPLKVVRTQFITIDLSVARSDESIWSGYGRALSVIRVGTGEFTLKVIRLDGSEESYTQSDLISGMVFENSFMELKVTNSAQAGVTNPIIAVDYEVV